MAKNASIIEEMTKEDLKYLKSLQRKSVRKSEKKFLAEGIRLLEESLNHRFLPIQLFVAESVIGDRGKELVERFKKVKVPIQAIKSKELAVITDTETAQGVAALFDIPDYNPEKIIRQNQYRILYLDHIADPGNAGTLIRSALAFGFNAVFLSEDSVENFNPKVIRATVGAVFGIPVLNVSAAQLKAYKRKTGIFLVGTDLKGVELKKTGSQLRDKKRLIVAIGSEAEGLSTDLSRMSDIKIKLAHSDRVESLNAAVAGSIIMNEIYYLK